MDEPKDNLSVEAKVLDTKERKGLSKEEFADPAGRKLPIHDAAHVRNAIARFNQTQGMTPEEKSAAWGRIKRAAKKFGIEMKAESDDDEVSGETIVQAMSVEAMSLNVPDVPGHPNRMPFSGILVRLDEPSDQAPHGTNGKRIILTRAAAEEALPSLLGMGVDLKKELDGHDAQNKVGIITSATIDGGAIHISGWIYCSDFPRHALAIQLNKADLGFSFEASNIAVQSMSDEILTIKKLSFTGAAVLLKSDAAYRSTALAASAAKEHEMDDLKTAVEAAIGAALAPMTKTLEEVRAAQAAQETAINDLKQSPVMNNPIHAVMATVSKVEPHANRIEAAADAMEKDGVGLHEVRGHVHHLRRVAQDMRAAAARGMIPHSYIEAGSYFASAAPVQAPVAPAPLSAPKIEDSAVFQQMRASFEQQLQYAKDDGETMKTQMADMQAKLGGLLPGPQRKTITPEINQLLARAHLSPTDIEDGSISIAKLDAALANANLTTGARMNLKTALSRAGVISNGFPVTGQQ